MAGAEPEAEGSGEGGGGGGRAVPARGGSAVRVAPLGPEQLRRVLERVAKAQPPAKPPPPPPFGLQDAVRRLRDAAQQAAPQRGPGAEPPRPPRPLPPQRLEAVCVKATPGETRGRERPKPQQAAVQPRTARPSQLPGRHCGALGPGVTSPQLLGAPPLLSAQPQPPVQVLAQRPLPALRPVPAKRAVAPLAPKGSGAMLAPRSASDPLAGTPVSSSSANLFVPNLHMKHTERLKKSLKVKTRSGRISRPPKYKAKDYKFIKMEDLADSHPSDSDDYAELSVEEEEEQREKWALFDLSSCSLRPKTFRCQTCAKSYIGKGGLARHFRLNPGHGSPQPAMSSSGKANGSVTQGLPSARDGLQNGQSVEVEEASVSGPADGSYSALSGTERRSGPTRGCATVPAEPSAARSSASLQEFLHQCDRQDLVELALPQLAQAVTVYEFLLMKVHKDHLAKPFFPAVYKEFEELHTMVKKMCQDYLRSSGPRSQEPLEINNNEVAESLGITEGVLRKRGTHTDGVPHTCDSHRSAGPGPETAVSRKRESETAEAGLASAKRTRSAALPRESIASSADSGDQRRPAGGALGASEGSGPRVGGSACLGPEEGHTTPVSDLDRSAPQAGGQLKALADCAARSGSAAPTLSHQDVSGPGLRAQMGRPGTPTLEQVVVFPMENAQGHSSDLHAGDSLGSWGLCSSVMSEGGVASLLPGRSGHSGAGKFGQVPGSLVSGQHTSPGEALPVGAEAPPLGDDLSVVPMHGACSPEPELGPPLSTHGGLGSCTGDSDQVPHRTGTHADPGGLESTLAAGEAVVLEVAGGCSLLPQGQEQTLPQTSGRLLLPDPGSAVATLTEAEGPAPHTCPPEGLLTQPWRQCPPSETGSEPQPQTGAFPPSWLWLWPRVSE
ncbi:zinc finger protein 839 isoform X2 [Artibeus jamaicensis]|uniref:zinc finger protein 839 isoform X2 n=1 Tax=Artibeus jamaicensis TaxID=9417 RepID=UPI00235A4D20|nr:zinc finger protein 839 isoform X2 [Artibeus jamaicensis]XP_053522063.1 zinc finger protein 839 isoform X2 [Artibeus jamaicensis]